MRRLGSFVVGPQNVSQVPPAVPLEGGNVRSPIPNYAGAQEGGIVPQGARNRTQSHPNGGYHPYWA